MYRVLSCGSSLSFLVHTGWEKNSYGYHADDGCLFNSSGTGQQYGPPFSTGDVVGCGFNLVGRSLFFTKNGINLGALGRSSVWGPGIEMVHITHSIRVVVLLAQLCLCA